MDAAPKPRMRFRDILPKGLYWRTLLIIVAFLLYADRKVWAAVQMRRGPNVVGPFGLLQSFADLLKFVAATGADGLLPEASMKGFVNDTAEIARRIGDRMTLFSNIDPVAVLQNGSDADLEEEIHRQVAAGRGRSVPRPHSGPPSTA